jgi:hypothetical protein
MVALHDGPTARPRLIANRARLLLGAGAYAEFRMDVEALFSACAVSGTPGTREYVQQGIDGLRAFMATHAAHLKARSLKGV